jgi:TIR domain-containing protein
VSGVTHDVFICHSSKDRTIANAICSTLEQHHIRCWIAPRDVIPGSDYAGSIVKAIGGSRLTVLVFSSSSNESAHVRREIERTVSHGIPVLPFRVEEVVPSPALEYFISDAHWLDAMTPPLEKHLDHLVGTVQLLLEREAPAATGVADAAAADVPQPPATATTSGVGAVAARRRPSTPMLAAIGAAALVVVVGGALLLAGGGRPGASQTAVLPSASAASTATSGPTASTGVTPTAPGSTVAPSDAIARITAALPASLSCEPPETPTDSAEVASVFCYVGDGTIGYVDYTLYPDLATMRSDYGSWLDYYTLAMGTSGSCATGHEVEDAWSFQSTPSTTEGRYFCVVDDDKQANLYWTDEASLILVDLAGDTDVTLDQLYPIWRDRTYDPIRP